MKIARISPFSGKENVMDLNVTDEQMYEIMLGQKCIQDIVPHLNPDEREFLMTGITPDEWDEAFGED